MLFDNKIRERVRQRVTRLRGAAGDHIHVKKRARVAGPRADSMRPDKDVLHSGSAKHRNDIARPDVLSLHAREPFAQADVFGQPNSFSWRT
jgi:hypothetical protein